MNKSEKLCKMQLSAKTTGIGAISKGEMAVVSVFHGFMSRKWLGVIGLQMDVLMFYPGNSRNYFPQLIDYKRNAALLSGIFSLRNISSAIGG